MKLEDSLNQFVFPLVIQIAKGTNFTLVPLYLATLYVRLDEYKFDQVYIQARPRASIE